MTDIPEELVARVCEIICCEGLCGNEIAGQECARFVWFDQARSVIRAVLDWQASGAGTNNAT